MPTTFRELLERTRAEVRELSPEQLRARLEQTPTFHLVDVRESDEHASGAIPGALSIPRGYLELRIEAAVPRDAEVILYCAGGTRSALAARTLQDLGYSQVWSLAGGYSRWTDQGHPTEKPKTLSREQKERYRRHLSIPEVGEAGQAKLRDARVLVLGAGGLGSPAALYLAAAGVGTVGIVDSDVVELSNLQRQVLHSQPRLGMPKVQSAKATLEALNPETRVVPIAERLTAKNVLAILDGFDVVLDGGDNFATRYVLNDACVLKGMPNVHGSVFRFEGQVTTLVPGQGPCYRCLYPAPPPPELAPSCAEAGVLGVLPGTIGMLQATEALKLILGIGEPLVGRLMAFDALAMSFTTLRVSRDPECPVCRPGANVTLSDLDPSCAVPARG